MNILWISDGKKGHEKQVEALLNEISKTENITIEKIILLINPVTQFLNLVSFFLRIYFGTLFMSNKEINIYKQKRIDIIIGAGSSIYTKILLIKHYLNNTDISIKTISILSPSLYKNNFDIICAPTHDSGKLLKNSNVIYFEGSLAKVSTNETDETIGFIGIGGLNNHYVFDQDAIVKQIEYIVNLYSKKNWHIFTSRRTPDAMIDKIKKLSLDNSNLIISNDNYDELIQKASVKVVTKDSVNMVYECLSTSGKTFLFNMEYIKINKIVKQINLLLANKQIGYIENIKMADGLNKLKIKSQNPHNDVFAEVEKVAYQLIKELKK